MATLYSDAAGPQNQAKTGAESPIVKPFLISLSANPSVADVLELVKLPIGAIVTGFCIESSDIDTNATPTIDWSIGLRSDPTAYMTHLGISTNGGVITESSSRAATSGAVHTPGGSVVNTYVAGALPDAALTAEDAFVAKCVAVAATFAAGTLRGFVTYVMA